MTSYSVGDDKVESVSETVTVSERIHAYVWVSKYRWIWITLILLTVFGLAFLIGYLVAMGVHSGSDPAPPQQYSSQISESVRAAVTSADIDANLKTFAEFVHPAGTLANEELGTTLADMWKGAGLTVRIFNYSGVLLQYPVASNPNLVQIVKSNNDVDFKTTNTDSYFSAYSATGSFKGKLIYVNYGNAYDFNTLKQHVPCPPDGTRYVAIARYGDRIAILKRAEEWCRPNATSTSPIGALLLYGDPAEYVRDPARVWPNGPYLRGNDSMFGTMLGGSGDPLSPGLPSIDGLYRISESDVHRTKMLVQPISYDDAARLMRDLIGTSPHWWNGTMNISYNTGPGYSGASSDMEVRVYVSSDTTGNKRNLKDILGVIRGDVEHDRYVIVGAHYDAWTYGGNEPNSATSVLGRLAIAFQQQVNSGWRPRRSIIFANWDGEKFCKIGSQEFVDQFGPEIQKRTVAYINLDHVVDGNHTFHANGHPLLADVLYDSTKMFTHPSSASQETVYAHWSRHSQSNVLDKPPVDPVGEVGDLWSFWNQYGVPYIFPFFTGHHQIPFRHTMLDTYDMVNKYVDPGFKFHELFGRIMTDSILRLSDSAVLPYSFVSLAETLRYHYNTTIAMREAQYNEVIRVYIRNVNATLNDFVSAAYSFAEVAQQSSSLDDAKLRALNDKIMMVPQVFNSQYNVHYRRIPSLLYGADTYSEGTVVYFPGVANAMHEINSDDVTIRPHGEMMIQRELSALYVAFQQATNILRSQTLID